MLKRLLALPKTLLRLLFALLILFEEWGWAPLQRAMAWLGGLPLLRQLEAGLRRLPPYAALVALLLPTLLLVPVKLLALWLLAQGRAGLGIALVLAAKLVGTALLARLFALLQPALMRLGWFARAYARWVVWKQGLLDWIHATEAWQTLRRWRLALRRQLRAWWRGRA